jgi:hypothetical protein
MCENLGLHKNLILRIPLAPIQNQRLVAANNSSGESETDEAPPLAQEANVVDVVDAPEAVVAEDVDAAN